MMEVDQLPGQDIREMDEGGKAVMNVDEQMAFQGEKEDVKEEEEERRDSPTKKRKENPVSEGEALEEAGDTAPKETKRPRRAASQVNVTRSAAGEQTTVAAGEKMKVAREMQREKEEEEKKQKEKDRDTLKRQREEEAKSKRAAIEEAKRAKEAEREAKRIATEEAKRQKEEEKRQKEEERESKRLAAEQAKKMKEEERLQKEEERRLQKQQKEEERNKLKEQRELTKKEKEEEKRQKEEEKRQREEEKRQKEEEKRQREEEKRLKEDLKQEQARKQASVLMSFVKRSSSATTEGSAAAGGGGGGSGTQGQQQEPQAILRAQFSSPVGPFLGWIPPIGATLPLLQKWTTRASTEAFEKVITDNSVTQDEVLQQFNAWISPSSTTRTTPAPTKQSLIQKRQLRFRSLTIPREDAKMDVKVVAKLETKMENLKSHLTKHRVKLLCFDQSFRSIYFGTYTKQSPHVRARKFWGKAEDIDYEIDSEDEDFGENEEDADDLEKESMGSLDSEEEEDEKRTTNEYQFDAFVVPDGHLSDNEMYPSDFDDDDDDDDDGDDDGNDGMGNENGENHSKRKRRDVAQRAQQDRAQMMAQPKRRIHGGKQGELTQLTPTLTGLIMSASDLNHLSPLLKDVFKSHAIEPLRPTPISLAPLPSNTLSSGRRNAANKNVRMIPVEQLPMAAQFIHTEYQGSFDRLLASMRQAFPESSKKQLGKFLRENCEKKRTPAAKQGVWLIKQERRAQFALPLEDPIPPPPPVTTPFSNTMIDFATKTNSVSNSPKKRTNDEPARVTAAFKMNVANEQNPIVDYATTASKTSKKETSKAPKRTPKKTPKQEEGTSTSVLPTITAFLASNGTSS